MHGSKHMQYYLCVGLGEWDSWGDIPYPLIQVGDFGLVSLYVMQHLTPTPLTSHLSNNTPVVLNKLLCTVPNESPKRVQQNGSTVPNKLLYMVPNEFL